MTTNADSRVASDLCDQLGPVPARWYVLDRDGLATLCKDEDDAHDVAAECFVAWPNRGPHRVVLLGDVAAERERCAKLCEDQTQEYEPFTGQPRNLAYQCADAIRKA